MKIYNIAQFIKEDKKMNEEKKTLISAKDDAENKKQLLKRIQSAKENKKKRDELYKDINPVELYNKNITGNRLRELRLEKGYTLKEVAEELDGIGDSILGIYELGKRKPSKNAFKKLAEYYGVDYKYLLGESDIRNEEIFNLAFKEISDEEKLILDAYNSSSQEIRQIIKDVLKTSISSNGETL